MVCTHQHYCYSHETLAPRLYHNPKISHKGCNCARESLQGQITPSLALRSFSSWTWTCKLCHKSPGIELHPRYIQSMLCHASQCMNATPVTHSIKKQYWINFSIEIHLVNIYMNKAIYFYAFFSIIGLCWPDGCWSKSLTILCSLFFELVPFKIWAFLWLGYCAWTSGSCQIFMSSR